MGATGNYNQGYDNNGGLFANPPVPLCETYQDSVAYTAGTDDPGLEARTLFNTWRAGNGASLAMVIVGLQFYFDGTYAGFICVYYTRD